MAKRKEVLNPSNFYTLYQLPRDKDKLRVQYSSDPFSSILEYVELLGAKTIIAEKKYLDVDYRSEFVNFYAKAFRRFKSLSTRLHFFARRLNRSAIPFFLPDQEHYLGYCVLRPVPDFRVSRTMLKGPNGKGVKICNAISRVNLFGYTYDAVGMPFMQQDAQVGACAQAATWMALRHMHLKGEVGLVLPYDITDRATKIFSFGRELPSTGITTDQIAEAIRSSGLAPLYYPKPGGENSIDKWRPREILYRYLDSGVPVILALESKGIDHAVVAIGYKLDFDKKSMLPTGEEQYLSLSNWIDTFIIHNDIEGPYQILGCSSSPGQGRENEARDYCLDDLLAIIVPLPEKVYLNGEEAEEIAFQLINKGEIRNDIWKAVVDANIQETQQFFGLLDKGKLVLRTYFRRSNYYKEQFIESLDNSPMLQWAYGMMPMSRYIWVVELTSQELIRMDEPHILGEIIIDATTSQFTRNYLAIHLPGALVVPRINPDPQPQEFTMYRVDDDFYYPSMANNEVASSFI